MNYEILTDVEKTAVLCNIPAAVQDAMRSASAVGLVLAGGVLRDTLAGLPVKDVDIFCHSETQAETVAVELQFKLYGTAAGVNRSMFAYSLDVDGLPVQFVYYKDFDDAYGLVSQFDFRACCAGMWCDSSAWHGVAVEGFREDCANRVLRFMSQAKDQRKLTALRRALTFAHKGWTISNAELARIILHWQDIKPDAIAFPSDERYESLHAEVVHAFRPGYGGRR